MDRRQTGINREVSDLWDEMTPEEQAEFDMLLWDVDGAMKRYREDPVAFIDEVLHLTLTPYQEKLVRTLFQYRRAAFRGPHAAGKTAVAAAIILWFVATHEECKIPTTASTWRHLKEYLWPEIHKWANKADWWRLGIKIRPGRELMKLRLEVGESGNRFAFALASNDEAKMEGAHSTNILYVFDEAKAIEPSIWDAAEGALNTPNAFALAMSTPGPNNGRFYELFKDREKWAAWHTVVATAKDVIAAGHMTEEWRAQKEREWGIDSVLYKRRVLGIFAEDSGDSLIPLHLIERANERWYEMMEKVDQLVEKGTPRLRAEQRVWGALTDLGVDVAWMGDDNTGYSFRHGRDIKAVEQTSKQDTMKTAEKGVSHLRMNESKAKIDANGVGAGTYDRMKELWEQGKIRKKVGRCPIMAIMAQAGTKQTDKSKQLQFNRLRDYLWWHMKELLEDDKNYPALPPDEYLTLDLTSVKWEEMQTGRIKVEDKKSIKKRLGRSTDVGDAVVMSFAPDQSNYRPLIALV